MNKFLVVALVAVGVGCASAAFAQDLTNAVIKEVNLQGLKGVSEQSVRSQLEVQVGQTYNPAAVARDIRRLYDQGHFESIRVDAAPVAGGVALTYVIQEKRIISEVKIIGNKKIKASKVRAALTWKEGDAFSADAYAQELKAIQKLYEEKGFANTAVDINVEEVGPSRVRITYAITEGRKARIRSITFVGNQAISSHKLRKAMKTKHAWWFLGGKYNEAKIEADLEKITDEYGNIGYLEEKVTGVNIAYSPNGKKMDITVNISEGPQYRVGTLEVAGNVVYDDDEIMNIIKVHPGDIHNKGQVTKDAQLIAKGYQDSGYVNADAVPQVTLDRETKTTHVVDKVGEGDLKYVRQIEITGNASTKDEVIRREFMNAPGERVDGSALNFSKRRLENTRYFDAVRLTLRDVEDNPLYTDVLTDVEEGKTGDFNFGAGYSTEEKVSGFAELRLNNFDITSWPTFSGGGQLFQARLQLGNVRSQYNISFTDPEFLGYPFAFGLDVFDESYKYTENSNYREETRGGQLRLGKTLSPFVTVRTALRYSDVSYGDLAPRWLYTREWRRELVDSTTVSNSWALERNTLDYPRDPAGGAKHELVGTLAGLGGDNNFLKLEHSSTWYWALDESKKWVLSFRTREGWADEYGDSEFVPISERFFAGGTSTVRGYDVRAVGPRARRFWLFPSEEEPIGGKARLIENLEVKYKLTDMFRLYGFVDAGGVWKDISDFSPGDIRYSTGLGFGVDVPKIGPVRIDYGIPLNPDDDQGHGRLHLVTGFRF